MRSAALAFGALAIVVGGAATASADSPPPAPPPPSLAGSAEAPVAAPATVAPASPSVAAPTPDVAPVGAVVVALSQEAAAAARALARELYREPALRPSLDEPTVRALAASPPSAPEAGSLGALHSALGAQTGRDAAAAELARRVRARLVVLVMLDGDTAVARVYSVAKGRLLPLTLQAASTAAEPARWPGAVDAVRELAAAPIALPPLGPLSTPATSASAASAPPGALAGLPGPLAPLPEEPKKAEATPWWKSAWFWGTFGGVSAASLTIGLIARATGSTGTVHFEGTVPR